MKKLLLSLLLSSISYISFSQDAENCKDHPLFNRLSNFHINGCTESFAAFEMQIAEEKFQTIEGTLTHLQYSFNPDITAKRPSWLQIMRNYEAAIFKAGGKKIFSNSGVASYKLSQNEKETHVIVTLNGGTDNEVDQYWIDIVEKEAMKQEIEASAMFKEISETGHIALYINFETGKSAIKPESQGIINQIAELLKTNPTLNVNIEGHTDNVGTPVANKTLSENRAKAVMNAVVAKGVAATRMSAKGMGQDKPVADNKTEDGRAKNRRVEIVKK